MESAKNESNTAVIDTLYGLITEAFCNYIEMLTTSPKTSIYAFHARNILECLVWVRYCLADPQNAVRFNEDANRDMEGLNLALKKFAAPVSGIPGALERIRWIEPNDSDHIRDVLTKQITDTRYKDVKEAAKEQGQWSLIRVPLQVSFQSWRILLEIAVIYNRHWTSTAPRETSTLLSTTSCGKRKRKQKKRKKTEQPGSGLHR
jgi:hypothetical protein